MKLTKRLLSILLIVVMGMSLMTFNAFAADPQTWEVADETELRNAINSAAAGDIVKFTADIEVSTPPLAIYKELTINLNGFDLVFPDASLSEDMDEALYVGTSNVTIKNGTISLDETNTSFSFIRGISVAEDGKLALNKVELDVGAVKTFDTGRIVLKAGLYDFDPTDYVNAASFDITDNGDGTWTVSQKVFVASWNETNYETFNDAIDAAGGAAIAVLEDGDGKTVPDDTGKAFKLNTGDYTVEYKSYVVLDNTMLSVDASGKISAGLFETEVAAADIVEDYKCVKLEENKYEVKHKDASDEVGTVNGVVYYDWDKAVQASHDSGEPVILSNSMTLSSIPTMSCSIEGKSGKSLEIKGYKLEDGTSGALKVNDDGKIIGGTFVTTDLAGLKAALPTADHYNYEPDSSESPTKYTVRADSRKARIDSTDYFTVTDAISQANADKTIVLLDNYELKGADISGRSYKMDPNGKELKVTLGSTYTVKAGPLVVKNGLIAGGTFDKEVSSADLATGYVCKKSGSNKWVVEQGLETVEVVLAEGEKATGGVEYYKNEKVNGGKNKDLVFKVSTEIAEIYADYNAESGTGIKITNFTQDKSKKTVTMPVDSLKNNSELEGFECKRYTLTFIFKNGAAVSTDKASAKPIYLYVWPDIKCSLTDNRYVHGDDTLQYVTVTISDPNDFPLNDSLFYYTAADSTTVDIKTNMYHVNKTASTWTYEIDKAVFDNITPGTMYLGFRYDGKPEKNDIVYGYGINIYPEPYLKALDGGSTVQWSKNSGDLQLKVNPNEVTDVEIHDSFGNVIRTISKSRFSVDKGVLTIDDSELSGLKYNTAYIIWADTANGEASIPLTVGPGLSIKGNDSHTKGGSNDLTFKATDEVTAVYIDGSSTKLDSKNYNISSDGLTVTLTAAYLNTLSTGTHTIKVSGPNGTATSTFKVITPGAASNTPGTGDNSNIGLYIGLLAASVVIAAAVIIIYIKSKKKAEAEVEEEEKEESPADDE